MCIRDRYQRRVREQTSSRIDCLEQPEEGPRSGLRWSNQCSDADQEDPRVWRAERALPPSNGRRGQEIWDLYHRIQTHVPLPWNQEMAFQNCLLYTSPSPRDRTRSRMPSSA
eukprot:TRINITY_DN2672_c0_g1_i2.p2 TRINITY_DN2672_c0_g1~~TRINITY_DN2672_c0_g1_i2.p2  ORF type:complete len:112 (-),score=20.61 TRINITY_DN2672_c0_g1_i2:67-402(-)